MTKRKTSYPSLGQENRTSESLFKEIMDTKFDDMRMTYLLATAEVGSPEAKRLIQGLGASDPTWLEGLRELKL